MKEEHKEWKSKFHPQEIHFLVKLLIITALLHIFFLAISKSSSLDLSRFLTRSNAALDGKISYKDEPLLSDPKPLWTYVLAIWLFLCRSAIGLLLNSGDTHSYDEIYAKMLGNVHNSIRQGDTFAAPL
ncbi:MAG: hypothetical protein ACFFB3_06225, partial [Candidatus Hodarchaeota archaeon]